MKPLTSTHRRIAQVGLIVLAASAAGAADFLWNNPDGGIFGDLVNWDDGTTGVPGIEDTAVFDLDAQYWVLFMEDQATDRLLIRQGMIGFAMPNLPQTYSVLNPISITPSIVIGEGSGNEAELVLDPSSSLHGQFAELGYDAGSTGILTVQGPGHLLDLDQQLHIGYSGAGYLNVDSGAMIGCGAAGLGLAAGSFGQAAISGAGAEWTCDGPLTVGSHGEGEMFITGGADVSCDDSILGLEIGATGDVSLSGLGSTWFIHGSFDVGMYGDGTLLIEEGANVFNFTFATLGTFPHDPPDDAGIGEVIVRGLGSMWWVQGYVYVGFLGDGTLILSEGGRLHVDGNLYHHVPNYGSTQLVIELGGSDDYQQPAIFVGGDAQSFQPQVTLVSGFIPEAGDAFAIAQAVGEIEAWTFDLPALPYPLDWSVIQTANDISLEVVSLIVPGDVNGDGVVDVLDLLEVLAAWGDCPGCPADLNGDGVVNVLDLLEVLANWTL